MNEFEEIILKLIDQLRSIKYKGDLSDIGNEMGMVLGEYIQDNKLGYELDSFFHGIKHGISLKNGTH